MTPRATQWSALKVYLSYRLLLSSLLLILGLFFFEGRRAYFIPLIYHATALTYFFICLITLALQRHFEYRSKFFIFFTIVIDISLITYMAHASGGLGSNLYILLVVAVAAGGILLHGRVATLLAAIATLSVLSQQIYFYLQHDRMPDFSNAGFLGLSFFAISFISQKLAQQLGETQARASRSEEQLAEWREFSTLIIQRMRTGIIVLSASGDIQLINDSCKKLIKMPDQEREFKTLSDISPVLQQQLTTWLENASAETLSRPIKVNNQANLIKCDFMELADSSNQLLAFIEDATTVTQQAQQMKLNSLAKLTASIAHEIRNPLGAISHAAQLLQESPSIQPDDQKLTNIIVQHSGRMNEIIENVLYLSRRKKPHPSPLLLKEWIAHFIPSFQQSYQVPIEITLLDTPEAITVVTDKSQIEQALTNLIDNGLRYSNKRIGKYLVELSIGLTSYRELPFIKIKDFGPGIPESERDALFEPFNTSEPNGTGLGLYLARELCEINRANLTLLESDATGSSFQITFPHPKQKIWDRVIAQ